MENCERWPRSHTWGVSAMKKEGPSIVLYRTRFYVGGHGRLASKLLKATQLLIYQLRLFWPM